MAYTRLRIVCHEWIVCRKTRATGHAERHLLWVELRERYSCFGRVTKARNFRMDAHSANPLRYFMFRRGKYASGFAWAGSYSTKVE